MGLPLFLDTIGTVVVACVSGALPGILTALLTNALCTPFNGISMYFAIINIAIAMLSTYYINRFANRGFAYKVYFVLAAGLLSGGVGAYIQWHLLLSPQNHLTLSLIETFSAYSGISYSTTFTIINIFINILDKGISIGIALNILYFIPERIKLLVKNGAWKQTPLTDEELSSMRKWSRDTKFSMRNRMTLLLFIISVLVIVMMAVIEMRLYFDKDLEAYMYLIYESHLNYIHF